jgi:hypothetical protein
MTQLILLLSFGQDYDFVVHLLWRCKGRQVAANSWVCPSLKSFPECSLLPPPWLPSFPLCSDTLWMLPRGEVGDFLKRVLPVTRCRRPTVQSGPTMCTPRAHPGVGLTGWTSGLTCTGSSTKSRWTLGFRLNIAREKSPYASFVQTCCLVTTYSFISFFKEFNLNCGWFCVEIAD